MFSIRLSGDSHLCAGTPTPANSTSTLRLLTNTDPVSASAHGSRRQQAAATMPIHNSTSIPQDPIRSLVDTSVEDDENDDDEILDDDDDMTDDDERKSVSSNANNNLLPVSDDVCESIGSASDNNAGHPRNATMLDDNIRMTGQEQQHQQQQLYPRRKGTQRLNTSSCAPTYNMPPCSSNNLPPLPIPATQPCTTSNHYFATTTTTAQGSSNANAVHITPLHYIPYVHGGYAAAAPLFVTHSKFAYILKKLLPGAYEELSVLLRICEVTFGTSGGGGAAAVTAADGSSRGETSEDESTALCLGGGRGNNNNNTKYKGMNPTHTQASSSSSSSSPNVVTSSSNSLLALDTKAGRKDIMVVSTAGAVLPVTMPEVTLADPVKSKSNN